MGNHKPGRLTHHRKKNFGDVAKPQCLGAGCPEGEAGSPSLTYRHRLDQQRGKHKYHLDTSWPADTLRLLFEMQPDFLH